MLAIRDGYGKSLSFKSVKKLYSEGLMLEAFQEVIIDQTTTNLQKKNCNLIDFFYMDFNHSS